MTHLIATGIDGQEYWRRELNLGEVVRLGRAPRNGWAVPWDLRVSREHAELELVEKGLQVTVLETARNPILFKKKKLKEFTATTGDSFQIGRTFFQFHDMDSVQSASTELVEYLFTNREMRDYQFKDAQRCLESMCEVPRLMSDSLTDEEFATKTVELLLEAMPDVAVVAVIQFDSSADYNVSEPKLIRWNSHKESEVRFEPSRRLMAKVLQRRCNAIHLWEESQGTNDYTMSGDLDWAFCTPIPSNEDRWCLYISGRRQFEGLASIASPTDLVSELRFAELVANFIGASHKVRSLERQQNEMTNYFSPFGGRVTPQGPGRVARTV